ncbi:MAG: hypothetical protein RI897_2720 [Verrucomicrobiota bacterium]
MEAEEDGGSDLDEELEFDLDDFEDGFIEEDGDEDGNGHDGDAGEGSEAGELGFGVLASGRAVEVLGEHGGDGEEGGVDGGHDGGEDGGEEEEDDPGGGWVFVGDGLEEVHGDAFAGGGIEVGEADTSDPADREHGEGGEEGEEDHDLECAFEFAAGAGGIDALDGVGVEGDADGDDEDGAEPFDLGLGIGWCPELGCGGLDLLEEVGGSSGLCDDDAEDDEAAEEEDEALDDVGPGDAAESAEGFVEEDDDGEEGDADPGWGVSPGGGVGHDADGLEVGDDKIGHRNDAGDGDEGGEQAVFEAPVDEVGSGDELVLAAELEEARGIEEVDGDDGHHEGDADEERESVAVGFGGEADHGIAAVLGGVESGEQDPQAHGAGAEVEVAEGVAGGSGAASQPSDGE